MFRGFYFFQKCQSQHILRENNMKPPYLDNMFLEVSKTQKKDSKKFLLPFFEILK